MYKVAEKQRDGELDGFGGSYRDRTYDQEIKSLLLYQLS